MSIELSWVPSTEADFDHYEVERSIVGTITSNAEPFNIQTTDTLEIRVDGNDLLQVDFSSVTNGAATAEEVAEAIDAAISEAGGRAAVDNGSVIIQSRRQNDRGSLRIAGGSSLSELGLEAKKYTLLSDWHLINELVDSEMVDDAGQKGYFYRIIAVNDSDERSLPSEPIAPTEQLIELAVIYGTLIDHSGKPLANTEVQYGAPLLKRPSDDRLEPGQNDDADFGIASNKLESVMTNSKGYFQMTVPAAIPLRIKIDATNFDQVFETPSADNKTEFNKLNDAFSYQSFGLSSQFDDFE